MVTHPRTPVRVDRLRAVNEPVHLRVVADNRGRPVAIVPADEPADKERAIENIIDSWRIDDEWWRTPISRRYLDVVLKGGGHVVLFEDLNTKEWYQQMP